MGCFRLPSPQRIRIQFTMSGICFNSDTVSGRSVGTGARGSPETCFAKCVFPLMPPDESMCATTPCSVPAWPSIPATNSRYSTISEGYSTTRMDRSLPNVSALNLIVRVGSALPGLDSSETRQVPIESGGTLSASYGLVGIRACAPSALGAKLNKASPLKSRRTALG